MQSVWAENAAAMPALAAAATLGGLHITLTGPGAARATARAGDGFPAYAHAAPAAPSGRRLHGAAGARRLAGAALLRGIGGAAGFIAEDEDAGVDTTGVQQEAGEGAPADSVAHLPLAPGTHNVTIAAPGALPEVRIVEVPSDGSGASVHVQLSADPDQPAENGQHAEARLGESDVPTGGFPYAILRGRGADGRHAAAANRAMLPHELMGAGVHEALVGEEHSGAATGGNWSGEEEVGAGDEGAIGGQAAEDDVVGGGATAEPASVDADGGLPGVAEKAAEDKLGEWQAGSFQNRVHDAIVGTMTTASGAAGQEAEVDPAAEVAVGNGLPEGAAAAVAVAAEKPHSGWWRALRGAIAAAGAAFVALQILRLYGRPAVVVGGGDGARRAPAAGRGGRESSRVVTHGHHSFHHRTPGIV